MGRFGTGYRFVVPRFYISQLLTLNWSIAVQPSSEVFGIGANGRVDRVESGGECVRCHSVILLLTAITTTRYWRVYLLIFESLDSGSTLRLANSTSAWILTFDRLDKTCAKRTETLLLRRRSHRGSQWPGCCAGEYSSCANRELENHTERRDGSMDITSCRFSPATDRQTGTVHRALRFSLSEPESRQCLLFGAFLCS